MLKTRVITALALLAGFLVVLFAFPTVYVAVAFGLLAAILGWEWAGLMRVDGGGRLLFGVVILASCYAAYDTADISFTPLWMASAIFWIAIVPMWLWRGWPIKGNDLAGYLSGWLLIVPTWAAMVRLQDGHPWWLFLVMGIAWVADISAYFAGRAWGRHKLAPTISPGKTWEGVLGAMVGVSIYAFIIAEIWGVSTLGRAHWLLFMVALAAISIIGDLFESMIKRQAGVKDSGQLLPGHGGFLDRLDSQTSVLPIATLILMGGRLVTQQRLAILGATGSIGTSTLDVVSRHPDRFKVVALTGHRRLDVLAGQCRLFRPRYAVVGNPDDARSLAAMLSGHGTEVLAGPEALVSVATLEEVDTVMAAIVGAAGLPPTLAAARAGKKILLANKEALVMAGGVFMREAIRGGALILPIDSEHNAVFQSLPSNFADCLNAVGVSKILLTASGGPFRTASLESLRGVTPDQACAHPNWSMGRKISVDSATMMNKGLEVIEARWLFNAHPDQIDVVIHPQSIIHSLVQYLDGSVIAELGNPDMRTPIAHALAYPERIDSGVKELNLFEIARLDFEKPDLAKFPCLDLAYQALRCGGLAPAVLNAANEVAVDAFLQGSLPFLGIAETINTVMDQVEHADVDHIDGILETDRHAREVTRSIIARLH